MYVLENEKEKQRLETQSQIRQYNLEDEISFFSIPAEGRVLDAGCGTGLLSNKLRGMFSNLNIDGCDLSQDRIKYAKETYKNIHFFEADLSLFKSANKYDFIMNRYVAHHVGVDIYSDIIKNIKSNLAENGKIGIIDVENNIIGLGTIDPWLNEKLELIKTEFYGDLNIGRKIPAILRKNGFKNIKLKVEAMYFEGEELLQELDQIEKRLIFAKDFLVSVLGLSDYEKFVDLYMRSAKEDLFFYNKILVQADV